MFKRVDVKDAVADLLSQGAYQGLGDPETVQKFAQFIVKVVNTEEALLPKKGILGQNQPNPFNASTSIEYALLESAWVQLEVYDMLGRKVKTLVNEKQSEGEYFFNWDAISEGGEKLNSGTYFYQLSVDNRLVGTKRMVLLK